MIESEDIVLPFPSKIEYWKPKFGQRKQRKCRNGSRKFGQVYEKRMEIDIIGILKNRRAKRKDVQ